MPDVIGIDHIYVSVSNLADSEDFYDRALVGVLNFRNNKFVLAGDPHIQYFNRHFGFVLRPGKISSTHEPYSPGLHHFCLRVDSVAEVQVAVQQLRKAGIEATESKIYPEYAHDYAATFIKDPDGIRLEITNYRQERRDRHDQWDKSPSG